ncbi:MAG: hypothetical protein NWS63_10710 [Saprospiraceae bacterium]|nr:hypothetical protein [Saprospiraceae bacterium]MDP4998674.1 hypothetical protein [Saprospiraceae bacterium]
MKILNVILMLALAWSVVACGGEAPTQEQTDAVETVAPEAAAPAEAGGKGPEFTSAYVCPMHCKGSGSDEPGKCPVCGMDYMANTNHGTDGHDH